MIQRIQSIFLTLIAAAMIGFLFVNIWQKSAGTETVSLNCMKMIYVKDGNVVQENETFFLAIGAIIIFSTALVSLLSFKNRLRQLQLGLVISVLIAALLGGIIYYSFQGEKLIEGGAKGTFGPGLLIPALSLILNSLANRFIRKDEEMVRSADRMR